MYQRIEWIFVLVLAASIVGTKVLALVRYLNLTDIGMVLGTGWEAVDITRRSEFPKLAYELGSSLS